MRSRARQMTMMNIRTRSQQLQDLEKLAKIDHKTSTGTLKVGDRVCLNLEARLCAREQRAFKKGGRAIGKASAFLSVGYVYTIEQVLANGGVRLKDFSLAVSTKYLVYAK